MIWDAKIKSINKLTKNLHKKSGQNRGFYFVHFSWRARQDLNLRPPESESVTLSPELRAHIYCSQLIILTQIVHEVKCNLGQLLEE